MRETQRIDQLNEGAAFLRSLPDTLTPEIRGRLANFALNMEKTAAFVVDRDAGPTLDAKSELTAMGVQLDTYQRVGAETVERLDKAINAGAGLLTQNNELRAALKSDLGKAEGREAAQKILDAPQPNVAEAAGVVTDLKEVEKAKE